MATKNKYPLPAFYFSVSWGENMNINFSEVSGLNVETQVIEYRDGASKEYATMKMPGMQKYGNLTLKRGSLADDNGFFDWWNKVALNTIERRDVTVSLLNEEHKAVITWNVKNAFPVKVDGGSLKSTGNEVLIETLELAHEGITMKRGDK